MSVVIKLRSLTSRLQKKCQRKRFLGFRLKGHIPGHGSPLAVVQSARAGYKAVGELTPCSSDLDLLPSLSDIEAFTMLNH